MSVGAAAASAVVDTELLAGCPSVGVADTLEPAAVSLVETPLGGSDGSLVGRPCVVLTARVRHKRTYGNKLVFLDGRKLPPDAESFGADAEAEKGAAEAALEEVEIVFDAARYGKEVRGIRKDISVGDVVRFDGQFRSCGRILEASSYVMLERWCNVSDGAPYSAMADGGASEVPKVVAERPRGKRMTSLCKFWISNGSCRKNDCACEHPEGEELLQARNKYFDAQKRRRAEATNPDDPHRQEDKKSHAQRASVLAEWLCTIYGMEVLKQNGVVDVAGGRGELAFELSVKRGVPCLVVDPRCPGLGDDARNGDELLAGPWRGWRLSRPQRLWLEKNVPGLNGYAACQAYVETAPLRQLRACTPPAGAALGLWTELVGGCAVVVGLHPDQATGSVVELATAFGKPFAVVPCCTFADDFPERQLVGGQLVRTYDDLLQWLQERRLGSQLTYLRFHGKNAVVYEPPRPTGNE